MIPEKICVFVYHIISLLQQAGMGYVEICLSMYVCIKVIFKDSNSVT
jgi:hypothetical protein